MKQGEGKPEAVRDEVNKVLKRMNTLQKQQKIRGKLYNYPTLNLK